MSVSKFLIGKFLIHPWMINLPPRSRGDFYKKTKILMRNFYLFCTLALCVALASCGNSETQQDTDQTKDTVTKNTANTDKKHGHHAHGAANQYMHKRKFEDLVKSFESPERVTWQKPNEIINKMGELKGKTVLDIGSGTGYFSFRLAAKGAKVIAGDVNEQFQAYIKNKQQELNLSEEQLNTRKLSYDSPELKPQEADHVIIVNTYHHVESRVAYFKKVLAGLKAGGKLWVIDYKKQETPHGPPLRMRLTTAEVMKELSEAGFGKIDVDSKMMPYQYMVVASK
jgi:2-polyprenyl-3-methyl-5-hydroxy-6-metoxy-1,4-benzoquinol methylase